MTIHVNIQFSNCVRIASTRASHMECGSTEKGKQSFKKNLLNKFQCFERLKPIHSYIVCSKCAYLVKLKRITGSANGRPWDSESHYLGSNPNPVALKFGGVK